MSTGRRMALAVLDVQVMSPSTGPLPPVPGFAATPPEPPKGMGAKPPAPFETEPPVPPWPFPFPPAPGPLPPLPLVADSMLGLPHALAMTAPTITTPKVLALISSSFMAGRGDHAGQPERVPEYQCGACALTRKPGKKRASSANPP